MPKTLLLADDSVTIQKVVGITFANEDVELVTVDNGADALVRAMELKPDLIMADIAMPGMGGYELCAAIRRDPELAGIPLLLLTGTFETYDEEKARAVGASGHIAKPFEAQALIGQFYALTDQERTRVVDPHSLTAIPQPEALAATAIPQPEALAATAIPQPEALAATAIPQPEALAATAIPQPEAPTVTAIPQPEALAATAIPQPEALAATAIPQPEAPATTAIPQPEAPA
ncbi:MAG: response regulator, partial [bacterium]|nr:response regulator [bacterium]